MRLDVNLDATIELTARLERLHRSAFPSAVRNTLNDLAFDMKKKAIPQSFNDNFKVKSGTMSFLKKSISVDKATGFNVGSMKSTVGFILLSNNAGKKFIDGLEKQEKGGVINDGIRYLKAARGGNNDKKVLRSNYYNKSKIVGQNTGRKGSAKSRLVARAYVAFREKKLLKVTNSDGNYLVKINRFAKNKSTKKVSFKSKVMAMSRDVKKTRLKSTNFVQEAGENEKKNMANFYQKNAEFQFNKHLR